MLKFLFYLFLGIGFAVSSFSQNIIQGVLKDNKNNPISLVNIRILSENRNELVAYTTTNSNGIYELQINAKGKYWFMANCVGFKEEQRLVEITTSKVIINFELKEDMKQLDEVVIKAKALDVYEKNDTISYNLKKLTNGNEINLKDVLKKLPGISLENGKIYAEGRVVDKILINGDEFALNQRTLSETLAAKMLSGIDLLKDYKQNTILTNFNTQKEQALNLKIKKEYLGVFKGEVGIGSGIINKYTSRITSYNLGDKLKMSLIGDASNTGENPITISEFLELKGGILSLFGNRPNPHSNEISLQNNIMPMSNNNSSKINNQFLASSLNYKISPKAKISGAVLYFNTKFDTWNETKTDYSINNQIITSLDKNDSQNSVLMEQGNLDINYRKSINENLAYKLSQSYASNLNDSEIYNSNFYWNHFFQEAKTKKNYIDQELSFLKRYSNRFVFFSSIRYTFEENWKNNFWFTSLNANETLTQFFVNSKNKLFTEIQLVYKPKKIQYEINFGCNFNKIYYYTNLIDANQLLVGLAPNNSNQVRFNNVNIYSNFSINKRIGFFQFGASLTPSYFELNSDKTVLLNYTIKSEFYISKNHHFDFLFKSENTIAELQKTLTGLFADSYRDYSNSSLSNAVFSNKKSYGFNYYYTKFRTGTSIYANLNYQELTNTITSNTTIYNTAFYSLNTYIISPLQKKYNCDFSFEQKVFDLPFRVKFKYNFDQNDFTNYTNGVENSMSIKKCDMTFSYQTFFKKPFNSNGGVYFENTANYSSYLNIVSAFTSYKPYLNLEYNRKSYAFGLTTTYVYLKNKTNISYIDISPYLKFKMNNSPFEISIEGNNVLNLKNIKLISIDYGNGYTQMNSYGRLSGYLLLKLKYFF